MPEYVIKGIPVNFPFEPYDLQKVYMEKVLECLENGTNGVLESPTGTGKTLSLLCSALGWLMVKKAQADLSEQSNMLAIKNSEDIMGGVRFHPYNKKSVEDMSNKAPDNYQWSVPKIIYASRTHSQLNQAIQELKRTKYRCLKAAVIGSRDQMCINPEVMKEENHTNKIHMCHHKILSKTCTFHSNLEHKKDHPLLQERTVMDIEDLVKIGRKIKACPYYLTKDMYQSADITFMPYNYLLDPKARKANKINLHNAVVILDEAHNVEKICEESVSIQIKNTDLALAIDEVTKVMKFMNETEELNLGTDNFPKDFTAEDLADLKQFLMALEKVFHEIPIENEAEGTTYEGSYIFELLGKANITQENFGSISSLADSLVQFISTVTSSNLANKGEGLQKIIDLLRITFSTSMPDYREQVKRCFKVHMAMENDNNKGYNSKQNNWLSAKTKEKTAVKIMSYWCFSPSFGMKQLMDKNIYCIILTSGTLAPMKPLITEIGIPISVRLENPHIVTGSQICVRIVSNGPDNQMLNSSYENRNNPKYIQSLGCTLLSFCSIVPNGLLVFFPSYPVMNKCQETWQCSGLWQQMCRIKPIFVEPRNKDAFTTVMNEFYERINDSSSRGAMFMAVCRGKVSEGLDFADMNGRAVVITGLPFPPLKDNKVILKKRYLQENRNSTNEFLSGDEWYRLEAIRAVNQAIGRVIRHKNDYGAILLCDTRFQNFSLKAQLSKWLQGHIKYDEKFGRTVGELCRFFKNAERTLPRPCLRPLSSEDIPNDLNTDTISETTKDLEKNTLKKFKLDNAQHVVKKKMQFQNVENANSAVSWSPDCYKFVPKSSKISTNSNKTGNLLERLEEQTTSINFNDMSSKSALNSVPLDSSADCTKPLFKKRKLKMVPTTQHIQDIKITNSQKPSEHCNTPEKQVAPDNRMEFLMLLKNSLTGESYGKFLSAINTYQHDKNYNSLLKILSAIFIDQKHLHYLFKGLVRFMKDPHKKFFEAYCDEHHIN